MTGMASEMSDEDVGCVLPRLSKARLLEVERWPAGGGLISRLLA